VNVALAILLATSLGGCSLAERLANGALVEPNGAVVEPNGEVIEPSGVVIGPDGGVVEPQREAAIETVITGLSEAQQVRSLTRQLAR
jgi:hypothetical protein